MNILYLEDYIKKINDQVSEDHFLYCNGQLKKIRDGENRLDDGRFYVLRSTLDEKDNHTLVKLFIKNLSAQPVEIKLFVGNCLIELKNNYIFVSPKKNVMFLANDDGLTLASGMIHKSPFSQYGVLKRKNYTEKISCGRLPLYPLGAGDVVGIYSLEARVRPYQNVTAYTWMIRSNKYHKNELLKWNEEIKSGLAFSNN